MIRAMSTLLKLAALAGSFTYCVYLEYRYPDPTPEELQEFYDEALQQEILNSLPPTEEY